MKIDTLLLLSKAGAYRGPYPELYHPESILGRQQAIEAGMLLEKDAFLGGLAAMAGRGVSALGRNIGQAVGASGNNMVSRVGATMQSGVEKGVRATQGNTAAGLNMTQKAVGSVPGSAGAAATKAKPLVHQNDVAAVRERVAKDMWGTNYATLSKDQQMIAHNRAMAQHLKGVQTANPNVTALHNASGGNQKAVREALAQNSGNSGAALTQLNAQNTANAAAAPKSIWSNPLASTGISLGAFMGVPMLLNGDQGGLPQDDDEAIAMMQRQMAQEERMKRLGRVAQMRMGGGEHTAAAEKPPVVVDRLAARVMAARSALQKAASAGSMCGVRGMEKLANPVDPALIKEVLAVRGITPSSTAYPAIVAEINANPAVLGDGGQKKFDDIVAKHTGSRTAQTAGGGARSAGPPTSMIGGSGGSSVNLGQMPTTNSRIALPNSEVQVGAGSMRPTVNGVPELNVPRGLSQFGIGATNLPGASSGTALMGGGGSESSVNIGGPPSGRSGVSRTPSDMVLVGEGDMKPTASSEASTKNQRGAATPASAGGSSGNNASQVPSGTGAQSSAAPTTKAMPVAGNQKKYTVQAKPATKGQTGPVIQPTPEELAAADVREARRNTQQYGVTVDDQKPKGKQPPQGKKQPQGKQKTPFTQSPGQAAQAGVDPHSAKVNPASSGSTAFNTKGWKVPETNARIGAQAFQSSQKPSVMGSIGRAALPLGLGVGGGALLANLINGRKKQEPSFDMASLPHPHQTPNFGMVRHAAALHLAKEAAKRPKYEETIQDAAKRIKANNPGMTIQQARVQAAAERRTKGPKAEKPVVNSPSSTASPVPQPAGGRLEPSAFKPVQPRLPDMTDPRQAARIRTEIFNAVGGDRNPISGLPLKPTYDPSVKMDMPTRGSLPPIKSLQTTQMTATGPTVQPGTGGGGGGKGPGGGGNTGNGTGSVPNDPPGGGAGGKSGPGNAIVKAPSTTPGVKGGPRITGMTVNPPNATGGFWNNPWARYGIPAAAGAALMTPLMMHMMGGRKKKKEQTV